jgi:hypothetical protein
MDLERPDLFLVIRGQPAPAGNKSAFPQIRGWRDGKPVLGVRVVEGGKSKASVLKVRQWREAVTAAVLGRIYESSPRPEPLEGPLLLWADFYLHRPRTVRREWPITKPDWSKLLRALEDPLVSPSKDIPGLIADDARIVFAIGGKFYAEDGAGEFGPRAVVRVWQIDVHPATFQGAVAVAVRELAGYLNDRTFQGAMQL